MSKYLIKSSSKYDLVTIAGNRPEIIKLSELTKVLSKKLNHCFVYTGQHFSPNMRNIFIDELGVEIDYDLGIGTSDVVALIKGIETFLRQTKPHYVIVYGDTNSTLAASIAAKNVNCYLIHIEAGLRSFNLSRIEERNRIKIDQISDYHFVPTEMNKAFLKIEKPVSDPIVTGNLIVDVCRKYDSSLTKFKYRDGLPEKFVLITAHRQETVDEPSMLKHLIDMLGNLSYPVIFPIHPRTKNNMVKNKIILPSNVKVIDALGYKEFLFLLKKSLVVVTDSGGVQEEAIVLKKPCITLSETTERQETLLLGANKLFPISKDKGGEELEKTIDEMSAIDIRSNPYGEDVTQKIYEILQQIVIPMSYIR